MDRSVISFGENRDVLWRIIKIHHAVAKGTLPYEIHQLSDKEREKLKLGPPEDWKVNDKYLAAALDVSTKCIKRDRDKMELLGFPLQYDSSAHEWYYDQAFDSFPLIPVNEDELLALLIASKALGAYEGSPFEKAIKTVYGKLLSPLTGDVKFNIEDIEQAISFQNLYREDVDQKTFDTVKEAILNCRIIEIDYKSAGSKRAVRKVEPYHLFNRDHSWYLIARNRAHKKIVTYKFSRISSVKLLKKSDVFEQPEFSIAEYMKHNAGMWGSDQTMDVKVRFSSEVADYITDIVWNDSQKIKQLKNGDLELSITLTNETEFKGWILNWGEHAEVLEPESFRKDMKQTINKMKKMY